MLVTFKYLGKTNVIQPLIAYPDFNQEKKERKEDIVSGVFIFKVQESFSH